MAPPPIERLKRQITDHVDAREARVEAFIARLDKFLSVNIIEILSGIIDGKASAEEAAVILGGLFTALEGLGLSDQLAELDQIYGRELRAVVSDLNAVVPKKVTLTEADGAVANALIDLDVSKVTGRLSTITDDVAALVMRNVIVGGAILPAELRDRISGTLLSTVQTETNTALASFYRTVTSKKAEEVGLSLFLYIGPDDKVTRPFCRHVLERDPAIYTRREIEQMDNGQGLDVMTSGGGYNCRHHWRPVSEDYAKELGYVP